MLDLWTWVPYTCDGDQITVVTLSYIIILLNKGYCTPI